MIPLGNLTFREALRAEERAFATLRAARSKGFCRAVVDQLERHADRCRAFRIVIAKERAAAPVVCSEPFRNVGVQGKVLVTPSKTSGLPDSVHEAR